MLKMKAKPKKDMGHLYKATNHVRGMLVLIWLTIVGYIVYVECYKDLLTIL